MTASTSGATSVSLIRGIAAVALVALSGLTGANDPNPAPSLSAGATVPSDPVFTARRHDGTTLSGRIRQIGGPKHELTLVPDAGPERAVPLDQLFKLTRDGATVAFSAEGSLLLFPTGDRLFRCVIGATTETTIEVQQFALDKLTVPLDALTGVVFTLPPDPDAFDSLIDRARSEPRQSEVLWLANGDRLTGSLLGLDDAKVKFQTDNGTVSLERPGVAALGFDPALASYAVPPGAFLELTLSDGSRLGVADPRIEHGQLVATTRFHAVVRVPIGELIALHARSAAIAYLSEREPLKTQYITYIGPPRPYRKDATVDGHPFRLVGEVYDRGLGTQSRTFLAYQVGPSDRRFQALVGLDDRAGPLGSVVFRVLVDGREAFVSPPMAVRDTPRPIDIDVANAKLLVLVTEFGQRGEVRDFADWIEARLVR